MITGEQLAFSYGRTPVLAGVDLASRPGRVLGLIGPNGSGKTTLLRLLYGALDSPTGEVRVDDVPLSKLSPKETARRLAVVVQEAGSDTTLSVGELVLLGRLPHLSVFDRAGRDDHEVATAALERVGATKLGHRGFGTLSGGERQRVLIARALAQQATHLLLDEPTNHLDIRYQHELLQLVRDLSRDGTTSVVVLHDLNLAARYCDDLVLLGEHGVAAQGETAEVLRPEILEPVYGIGVQRLELDGAIHLLFQPHRSHHTAPPGEDPMTTDTASTVQEKINEYWTLRAAEYDAYQRRPERYEADRAVWRSVWTDALGTEPRDVLDLGTGSGYLAYLLAALGHRVTGIDLAEGMLEQARAHVASDSPENPPRFLTGDAVDPEFPAGSFDAVVGRYVAWTLRDTKDALGRWYDLLRPGGTLALADSTWYPEGIADREAGNTAGFIADYYDGDVRAALPLHDAPSIEATADMVRAAGFTDVTVTPLTDLLELDRAHGVAPNHEVQMQYLVRATRP